MRPTGTPTELETRRRQAVALVMSGTSVAQTACEVGTTIGSVRRWLASFRKQGEAGLTLRRAPGGPRKLNSMQETELVELLRRGPQAAGLPYESWGNCEIVILIWRRFSVKFCADHVRVLVKRLMGVNIRELNRIVRSEGRQ